MGQHGGGMEMFEGWLARPSCLAILRADETDTAYSVRCAIFGTRTTSRLASFIQVRTHLTISNPTHAYQPPALFRSQPSKFTQ